MPRDGSVYVSPHAVRRAIDRLAPRDPKPTRYPDPDTTLAVEEWIRSEAKAAVFAGRRRREKPRWARLYGERSDALPDGQWFVWHPSSEVGWVVADIDRASGSCRVITTLVRVSSGRLEELSR